MSKIVVIGNGFDLRTHIKSSFRNFIEFVVYGCILNNCRIYTDSAVFSDETIRERLNNLCNQKPYSDIYNDQLCRDCKSFAETSFGKFIIENFENKNLNDLIYPKELSKYDDEDELIRIHHLLFYLQKTSIISTMNELFSESKINIELWSDVETVIELLVTKNDDLKVRYGVNDLPEWINETRKSFSEGLDLFESLFTEYLSVEQKKADIKDTFFSDIVDNHVESLIERSHGLLDDVMAKQLLEAQTADTVINYNYTDIAKRLYDKHCPKESLKVPSIIHINGAVSPCNKLKEFPTDIIIGYTNSGDNKVPKDFYPFEKSSRRILKSTEYVDINSLIKKNRWITPSFDLLIIGHSCCMADSDVIGKLLEHKKLNNAVVLCYDTTSLISAFNNIKAMVKPKKFAELMDYKQPMPGSPAHKLFFAVEHPKN